MTYFVSRQSYYFSDTPAVEIARGGIEGCSPSALTPKYKDLGEFQDYDDPREAVRTAIAISEAWAKDGTPNVLTDANIVAYGDEQTPEQLMEWAEKEYADLEKCANCGAILPSDSKKWLEMMQPPYNDFAYNDGADDSVKMYFCSQSCLEQVYDKEYEYWAETTRDEFIAQIDDTQHAELWLRDTRPEHKKHWAENYDLDAEGEHLFRPDPTGNDVLEIDLAQLLGEYANIGERLTDQVLDHAREVFTLEKPLVEIGG